MVEHQIVVLAVVSSILICQPKGEVVHWEAQQTVNLPSNDCAGSTPALPTNGVYFNLVEFMLWEHEVASSNLATPTN